MNSADDSFDPKSNVNALLFHTGKVHYLPPGLFKSTCVINVEKFPYDEQTCALRFGR
jgi:hypothetical protein